MCWSTTSTGCGNHQCSCSSKNNRRNLYVRPRYAGLVCSSDWILFCLFYGMCLRKPAFIPSCLQKLWSQNNTSSPFWNSHYLCNCRPIVRSIAASSAALRIEKNFSSPFLHQIQKSDTLARQQSRFDSSHKRAAMSVSPVSGNAIAAFIFEKIWFGNRENRSLVRHFSVPCVKGRK